MLKLQGPSPKGWLEAVLSDFDAFLIDHAACERKASATGMSFVVRYPDRAVLVEAMIAFAQEELAHFAQVHSLMQRRGLRLLPDSKDPYVSVLLEHVRTGRVERLLDRLLVSAVVEARGCERFLQIAKHHPEAEMRGFYQALFASEARHRGLFVDLAYKAFDPSEVTERDVEARHAYFLDLEFEVMQGLALRPALH